MRFRTLMATVATSTMLLFAPLASSADTVRFAVTDVEGLESLQREFGAFRDALSELLGKPVDFFPVSSRTAAVEAMNAKRVDFVLTGPAEYVVFKQRSDARVVVAWQRPDYFAQVVVLSDGPAKTVEDIRGKKVAFGAVGSTSQHLGPAQALTDLGLLYGKDYDAVIVNRNVAVEALLRGDIAAIGMNRTHLDRIRETNPEVSFTVVARGRDLPNDILVAGAHVDAALVEAMRELFVEHGKQLLGTVLQGVDNQKYQGGHFLANVKDSDYDYVRAMYGTIGAKNFASFVGD